jgi:hypothetical protein
MGQVIFLARFAQSIFEKMGVYLQYREQISLSDNITSVTSDNYFQDEELFDDPFSYESRGFSTRLTWMLPWSMKLLVGGNLVSKSYVNEVAYTSAEDTLGLGGKRLDDQGSYYINFSKSFQINRNWLNSLLLTFYYSYAENRSNSYWYNYKNAIIGGSLQWHF